MSNADVSTIERNVRRKEAGKFKGKTISHSDIMRRRGGDSNVVNFRNLGAGAGELVDGGKAVSISSNSTYNMYLFYMAPSHRLVERRSLLDSRRSSSTPVPLL